MSVFVTVGSTEHTALINAVLSEACLQALRNQGYDTLVAQYGNSAWKRSSTTWSSNGIDISAFSFKATTSNDITSSSLVIGHAGAGTILDVLRAGKPLIVIPNDTLMDKHQSEVADELSRQGYLYSCSPANLVHTIQTMDVSSLQPFPPFDGSRFQRLVDEEMGFI